jgi:probable rRNA maturation factor
VNVVEVVNMTRTRVDEQLVARLVARVLEEEGVRDAEASVSFVGEARIRALNREHRGKDEVTDVLSFPLEEWDEDEETPEVAASLAAGPPLLLGDIVVCARRALEQAAGDDLPPSFEFAVLLVHGALHLLGYDHETDAGEMALRQAEVLELVDWEGLVVAPSR